MCPNQKLRDSIYIMFRTIFSQHKTLFVSLGTVFLYSVTIAIAAPLYNPGDTLDPTCLPSSTDCTVASNGGMAIGDIISGGTAGEVLYTDATGNLVSDSLFTRDDTTLMTNIARTFGGGIYTTALQIDDSIGPGVDGSVLSINDGSSQIFSGVFDLSGYGGSVFTGGSYYAGADGSSTYSLVIPGAFASRVFNAGGDQGAVYAVPTGVVMSIDPAGVNPEYGFYVSGGNPGWFSGSTYFTLPTTHGSAGQVLTDNGIGELYWTTPVGGGSIAIGGPVSGGIPGEVLYIDQNGDLYGDSGFVRDSSTTNTSIISTDSISGDSINLLFDVASGGELFYIDDSTQNTSKVSVFSQQLVTSSPETLMKSETIADDLQFSGSGPGMLYVNAASFTGTIGVPVVITVYQTDGLAIDLSSISGPFTDGETVTGGTSGATGTVVWWDGFSPSGIIVLRDQSGPFTNGETITGGTSGETATIINTIFTNVNIYESDGEYFYRAGGLTPYTLANGLEINSPGITGNDLGDTWTWLRDTTFTGTFLQNNGAITTIGDVLSTNLGTKIQVDDLNQAIRFNDAYAFPYSDGTAGQVLTTDGGGYISWGNPVITGAVNSIPYFDDVGSITNDPDFIRVVSPGGSYTIIEHTSGTVVGGLRATDGTGILQSSDSSNSSFAQVVVDAFSANSAKLVYSPDSDVVYGIQTDATMTSIGNITPGGTGNGTKMQIDDLAQTIQFDAGLGLVFNNPGGTGYTFPGARTGTPGYVLADVLGDGVLSWEDPSLLPSDEQLKSNISDLEDGVLSKVIQLKTVTYILDMDPSQSTKVGFIAQDLENYFPELVDLRSDGFKGVYYAQMTPIIVQAIRELNMKVTDIADLTKENDWRDALVAWLGDMENGITLFFSDRIKTKELCIEDECLSESDVRDLIEIRNQLRGTPAPDEPPTDPEPTPDDTGDEIVTDPQSEEPTPEPEPTPESEPTPEATPETSGETTQ